MKKLFNCRRSLIAIFGISMITFLGIKNHIDTSVAISMICLGIAGANSAQGILEKKDGNKSL